MPYKDPNKQRECQNLSRKKRRMRFVSLYGGKCVKCGSKVNLEFDHKNRKSRTYKSSIWTRSRVWLQKELKKCQLLCKPCHIDKTHKERGDRRLVHGTMFRGYRRRCRCKLCRRANADYEHSRRLRVRGKSMNV